MDDYLYENGIAGSMAEGKNKLNRGVSLLVMCSFSVIVLLISAWEQYKLNNAQVFVIGKLYERHHGGSIANGAYYYYYLHDRKFTYSYATRGDVDSLIFLRVVPDDPDTKRRVEEKVPACLTIDQVPKEGWKELPLDACD